MLNCHTKGTRNVAIYAFSSGKHRNVKVNACVKYLTKTKTVFCSIREKAIPGSGGRGVVYVVFFATFATKMP